MGSNNYTKHDRPCPNSEKRVENIYIIFFRLQPCIYSMPFLKLDTIIFPGIGVDDMFVIVQAWDNLPPDVHKNREVAERVGLALKHAVSMIDSKMDLSPYMLQCVHIFGL